MITNEMTTRRAAWSDDPVSRVEAALEAEPGPVTAAHVVDFYRRYPGERVTFYTRLTVREPLADLTLRISLPPGLVLGDYQAPAEYPHTRIPTLEVGVDALYLVWPLEAELTAGTRYEYRMEATIASMQQDETLISQATVTGPGQPILAEESVSIAVRARGKYLRHLPALYEQDELMGRFLMLFESFLAPLEMQIDNIHYYFDPRVTPTDFLPWLASWLDLELDESWSEAGLRHLIRWAIALHRSRGTKWGLLKYLEIYTGRQAEIVEGRAKNFVLGTEARLGPGIALGRNNKPHTFTVTLYLPPVDAQSEAERERREAMRRRTIESIIDLQKPAHTVYILNLETVTPADKPGQNEAVPGPADEAAPAVDEIAAQAAIWFKLDGQ